MDREFLRAEDIIALYEVNMASGIVEFYHGTPLDIAGRGPQGIYESWGVAFASTWDLMVSAKHVIVQRY